MYRTFLLLIVCFVFFAGCSVAPYGGDFSCPAPGKGTCGSVQDAYSSAIDGEKNATGSDSQELSSYNTDNLLSKLERCSKAGDTACVKETRKLLKETLRKQKKEGKIKKNKKSLAAEETRKLRALRQASDNGTKAVPTRTEPVVMKTVILPYETNNGFLAGKRSMWIVVDKGDWVFDSGLKDFDMKQGGIGSFKKQ